MQKCYVSHLHPLSLRVSFIRTLKYNFLYETEKLNRLDKQICPNFMITFVACFSVKIQCIICDFVFWTRNRELKSINILLNFEKIITVVIVLTPKWHFFSRLKQLKIIVINAGITLIINHLLMRYKENGCSHLPNM